MHPKYLPFFRKPILYPFPADFYCFGHSSTGSLSKMFALISGGFAELSAIPAKLPAISAKLATIPAKLSDRKLESIPATMSIILLESQQSNSSCSY